MNEEMCRYEVGEGAWKRGCGVRLTAPTPAAMCENGVVDVCADEGVDDERRGRQAGD